MLFNSSTIDTWRRAVAAVPVSEIKCEHSREKIYVQNYTPRTLANEAMTLPVYAEQKRLGGRCFDSWYGEETFVQACDRIVHGHTACVPSAQKLLDKVNSAIDTDRFARTIELSVAGHFPCVPAYLAGHNEAMYRFHDAVTDKSPVRIYIGASHSGDVSAHYIEKRGVAALALALSVARFRPVELFTFHTNNFGHWGSPINYLQVIKHNTAPMMLGEVAWALTSAGYARHLMFRCGGARATSGRADMTGVGWIRGWNNPQALRSWFKAGKYDIVLPEIYSDSPDDKAIQKDAVAWVNSHVAKCLAMAEADEIGDYQ